MFNLTNFSNITNMLSVTIFAIFINRFTCLVDSKPGQLYIDIPLHRKVVFSVFIKNLNKVN